MTQPSTSRYHNFPTSGSSPAVPAPVVSLSSPGFSSFLSASQSSSSAPNTQASSARHSPLQEDLEASSRLSDTISTVAQRIPPVKIVTKPKSKAKSAAGVVGANHRNSEEQQPSTIPIRNAGLSKLQAQSYAVRFSSEPSTSRGAPSPRSQAHNSIGPPQALSSVKVEQPALAPPQVGVYKEPHIYKSVQAQRSAVSGGRVVPAAQLLATGAPSTSYHAQQQQAMTIHSQTVPNHAGQGNNMQSAPMISAHMNSRLVQTPSGYSSHPYGGHQQIGGAESSSSSAERGMHQQQLLQRAQLQAGTSRALGPQIGERFQLCWVFFSLFDLCKQSGD